MAFRQRFPCKFQFTPLREGRRSLTRRKAAVPLFQFTPLREGRPHPGARRFHFSISIHAPPRGATRYEVTDAASGEFQFTPLREGRPNAFSTLSVLVYFNSRPSARGDGASSSSTGGAALFQFTPLREGRPEMPDYWLRAPGYFNSRPSARGDPPHMPMAGKETYFNSRRSARGDRAYRRGWSISRYFNSRPSARGDAPDTHSTESSKGNFNSRPSARGDYDKAEEIVNVITFQFTPLREGRRCKWYNSVASGYFNSRPSARGDAPRFQFCPAA